MANVKNSKKVTKKQMTITEFRSMLDGMDLINGNSDWVPSKEQWNKIRACIENITIPEVPKQVFIKDDQIIKNEQVPYIYTEETPISYAEIKKTIVSDNFSSSLDDRNTTYNETNLIIPPTLYDPTVVHEETSPEKGVSQPTRPSVNLSDDHKTTRLADLIRPKLRDDNGAYRSPFGG